MRHLVLPLSLVAACSPATDSAAGVATTTTSSSTGTDPTPTTAPTTADSGPDPTTTTTAATGTTTEAGTTSTITEAESTGEPAPAGCGDGSLDPDTEACDNGYGQNNDMAACTLHCELNVCGDGHVYAGVEDCDQGANNNDSERNYGGCGTDCRPASHCGDSQVQALEECDLGPSNGSGNTELGGVGCDATCRFDAKLCFLTSAVYMPNNLGSAEKADKICRNAALVAGYDNASAFKAWVSDDASSPATRFTPSQLPFVLPSGVRVAHNSEQLLGDGPSVGITHTDKGEDLLKALVWTGTAPDGALFDPNLDCQGWTSNGFADQARIGRSGVDKSDPDEFNLWKYQHHWTDYKTVTCDYQNHLYCFEQ